MSKTAASAENTQVTEIRSFLLKTFDSVLDDTKAPKTSKIEQCHKQAISLKAFDLVSISMSLTGYIGYRWNQERYYKTLNILNDAHYLANSSNSLLALKINMYLMAQIEFLEQNYPQSLELMEAALHIKLEDTEDFDNKIQNAKTRIEKMNKQKVITSAPPTFIPENNQEDPLIALLKVGRTIAVETNIDTLLKIIAQEIKQALNADRCTVFLLDEEKHELWSKVALGLGMQEIRFASNLGLAGHVATTGETVNIKDAYTDKRFNKEIDMQTGYKTKTILCMPIRNLSHQIVGVFQVLNKKGGEFTAKDEDLLIAIGSSAGIALENANLFNKQKILIEEQKQLFSSFIDTLSASIDARDKITSGHSKRVTMYASLICDELNMNEKEKEVIKHASLLHDIGKIGIKDSILQKEGKLTPEEYDHIKQHANITHDILGKIYVSKEFENVAQIASSHHERYDGTGYFQGLKGDDIPLGGRILAVSDVFDAITSKRHYRSKMQIQDAIKILIDGSGSHFDKKIVDVFLSITCDKIINVLTCDFNLEISQNDRLLLEQYKLADLYAILTKEEEGESREKTAAQVFDKYYNFTRN
ncbi:TPA: GAF domain-containing protein [Candidatus Galligastranaerophilus faecipullorum]|nr:GAF domain-containing protein [Candidatus Galligastranaerophilus faecipullorum]